MLLLPVILGSILFAVVLAAGWSYRHWPSRRRCPVCNAETVPLAAEGLGRMLKPVFVQRWCGGCEWQGLGRPGPEFSPVAGPAAHDSGFRWNADAPGPLDAFAWRDREAEATDPDPAHPSGFRWADTEEGVGEEPETPAHPSGFTWGARPSASAPPSFQWGASRRPESGDPGFVWGDAEER